MKSDKHLINESDYQVTKKAALDANNDYLLAAYGAFEGIVDSFTELSDKDPETDIVTLIYHKWNGVASSTQYINLSAVCRHLADYLLVKYWLFGDVFSGMVRDGEILSDGECIGHSLDKHAW